MRTRRLNMRLRFATILCFTNIMHSAGTQLRQRHEKVLIMRCSWITWIPHDNEVASDLWSVSAVAWTWAAYCRFQRTSSNEGRLCDSGDMHLLVIDITIDRDSWELVVSTAGSTILRLPSWLPKDVCHWKKKKILQLTFQVIVNVSQIFISKLLKTTNGTKVCDPQWKQCWRAFCATANEKGVAYQKSKLVPYHFVEQKCFSFST